MFSVRVKDVYVKEAQPVYVFVKRRCEGDMIGVSWERK